MITTEDRFEIEELAARYNLAIDLGDATGWVNCFLPDGEFVIEALGPWMTATHDISAGSWQGVSELTTFAEKVTGGGRFRHWSYNRLLAATAEGINAISYMNVYYLDSPPERQLVTGVMRDVLRRPAGGGPWRFASRRITFDR